MTPDNFDRQPDATSHELTGHDSVQPAVLSRAQLEDRAMELMLQHHYGAQPVAPVLQLKHKLPLNRWLIAAGTLVAVGLVAAVLATRGEEPAPQHDPNRAMAGGVLPQDALKSDELKRDEVKKPETGEVDTPVEYGMGESLAFLNLQQVTPKSPVDYLGFMQQGGGEAWVLNAGYKTPYFDDVFFSGNYLDFLKGLTFARSQFESDEAATKHNPWVKLDEADRASLLSAVSGAVKASNLKADAKPSTPDMLLAWAQPNGRAVVVSLNSVGFDFDCDGKRYKAPETLRTALAAEKATSTTTLNRLYGVARSVAEFDALPRTVPSVTLHRESVKDKSMDPAVLLPRLKEFTGLYRVGLNLDMDDDQLQLFTELPLFAALTLDDMAIRGKGFEHLTKIPNLQQLVLQEMYMLDEEVAFKHIASCPSLAFFEFTPPHRSAKVRPSKEAIQALAGSPTIQMLKMTNVHGIAAGAFKPASGESILKVLELHKVNFLPGALKDVAAMPMLVNLKLKDCAFMKGAGLAELAGAKTLQALDVSGTKGVTIEALNALKGGKLNTLNFHKCEPLKDDEVIAWSAGMTEIFITLPSGKAHFVMPETPEEKNENKK